MVNKERVSILDAVCKRRQNCLISQNICTNHIFHQAVDHTLNMVGMVTE